jgi:hypothetical protein
VLRVAAAVFLSVVGLWAVIQGTLYLDRARRVHAVRCAGGICHSVKHDLGRGDLIIGSVSMLVALLAVAGIFALYRRRPA